MLTASTCHRRTYEGRKRAVQTVEHTPNKQLSTRIVKLEEKARCAIYIHEGNHIEDDGTSKHVELLVVY